jgi:plastocyanin
VVHISGYTFGAPSSPVHAGEAVTVVNDDAVAHTYTADNGAFDTGTINPHSSGHFTAPGAGSYAVHCDIHVTMHGNLSVA